MYGMRRLAALGCLAILAGNALADDAPSGAYAIPPDKSSIEPCRKAALAAHPGRIERFQMRHAGAALHYIFEIEDSDRRVWTEVCDAKTQTIIETTGAE